MMAATGSYAASFYAKPRLITFAVVVACAVLGSRVLPPGWSWEIVALGAVAISIWHGAFDNVLAEEALKPRWGTHWKPVFYGSYLALATLVLCLWWWVPVMALAGFLLYSALHFGTEAEQQLTFRRAALGLLAGLVPIAAACHWWPSPVASIFTEMLRGNAQGGAALTLIAGVSLWPAVLIVTIAALGRLHQHFLRLLLLAVELLLFRYCSPLAAFAVYFCFWHTPEHLVSTSVDTAGRFQSVRLTRHLRQGLAPWLLALTVTLAACWYGRHAVEAYTGTLFIALSALTVPHMVLAEVCRQQENSASERERMHTVQTRSAVQG